MSSVRFDPDNALTRDGGGRAEIKNPTEPKTKPEQVGQNPDQALAARRAEALNRLRRQQPAIRRKDQT